MALTELAVLLIGLGVVSFFSEKVVECATHLAHRLKVPPLIIGVFLISMGTDIPEIANSVFSSYANHGDINVGDTFGSCLTQITLVLGLVTLLGGTVLGHRRNVLVLGGCAIAAVAIAVLTVIDGELSRTDAGLLMLGYIILMAIAIKFSIKELGTKKDVDLSCMRDNLPRTIITLLFSMVFVVVGAAIVVRSAVGLSIGLKLPEYFISFFVIGIGTSLPELSVELMAIRKKNYGLVLGDLLGSNITDATLALGIGPLLFPTIVSGGIIAPLALYVIVVSTAVVALFAWREKVDKKAGILLIGMYLLSLLFTTQ